jgi:hypothetical protein
LNLPMSRGAHSFKQRDLTRAVAALLKAGARDWRIELTPGKIIVTAGRPEDAPEVETSADLRKLL